MNEQEIINTLTSKGGNLWEKNGMRRIYFDTATILEFAGLECQYYNTGNISSATLKGERISNSEAKRIFDGFSGVKMWYDLSDNGFYSKGWFTQAYKHMWSAFAAECKQAIA